MDRLSSLQERVLFLLGLVVYSYVGYFLVGLNVDPQSAWRPHTWLDDRIPLVPWAMWIYALVYTVSLYPAFVVRSRALFRRVALAYWVVITISLLCFWAIPATSIGLRPDLAGLDLASFHNWGLKLNYLLDPPTNLFPSLHLSCAVFVALCAWRARPLYGYVALVATAAIAFAICAVKQHYVLDGVAGLLLGVSSYFAFVHRYEPQEGEELAFTWRGPTAYLAFQSACYLGLYLAFLAGWSPWEGR